MSFEGGPPPGGTFSSRPDIGELIEIIARANPDLALGAMLDPDTLAGRTVLVACDDLFTSDYVRECLCASGARVIGPVQTVRELADLIEAGDVFDCGLISCVLDGEGTTDLIAAVQKRPAPVVLLLTRKQTAEQALAGIPSLSTPFGGFQAVNEVAAAIRLAAT